jgi:hypothetical protein
MNPIPLPWMLLAFLIAVGGAGATGYWKGGKDTGNRIAADLARTAAATREAQDAALNAAAEHIAKLDVKSTTIRQKTEVITREIPIYGDCRHDPRTLGLLNDALGASAESADPGELPGPDAAGR